MTRSEGVSILSLRVTTTITLFRPVFFFVVVVVVVVVVVSFGVAKLNVLRFVFQSFFHLYPRLELTFVHNVCSFFCTSSG